MTDVLPAPLGPSRPTTSPRPTVKETPSTAVRRPYRLRNPAHHTAGDGGRPPRSRAGASRARAPPRRGRGQAAEQLLGGLQGRVLHGQRSPRATARTSSSESDPPTAVTTPSSTQ